jgi:hypothetical protein
LLDKQYTNNQIKTANLENSYSDNNENSYNINKNDWLIIDNKNQNLTKSLSLNELISLQNKEFTPNAIKNNYELNFTSLANSFIYNENNTNDNLNIIIDKESLNNINIEETPKTATSNNNKLNNIIIERISLPQISALKFIELKPELDLNIIKTNQFQQTENFNIDNNKPYYGSKASILTINNNNNNRINTDNKDTVTTLNIRLPQNSDYDMVNVIKDNNENKYKIKSNIVGLFKFLLKSLLVIASTYILLKYLQNFVRNSNFAELNQILNVMGIIISIIALLLAAYYISFYADLTYDNPQTD